MVWKCVMVQRKPASKEKAIGSMENQIFLVLRSGEIILTISLRDLYQLSLSTVNQWDWGQSENDKFQKVEYFSNGTLPEYTPFFSPREWNFLMTSKKTNYKQTLGAPRPFLRVYFRQVFEGLNTS